MGCATQIWWGGGGPPSHATVRLDADGNATVSPGIQDIGTGTLTSAQIVAAEELGLPLAHVRVVGGDTAPNVYGPVVGRLADDAVRDARRALGGGEGAQDAAPARRRRLRDRGRRSRGARRPHPLDATARSTPT